MTFTWPWLLLSIPLILAAAAWVLLRPHRMHVTVGSIRLWSEALASLSATGRSRRNRIVLSWLLILLGCLLIVTALARPVHHTSRRMRRMAVIVAPTAEFTDNGGAELFDAVDRLLGRLNRRDRVQLVFPSAAGGQAEWLRPALAAEDLRKGGLLPGRYEDVTFPPANEADQIVAVIPAGREVAPFGAQTVIEVPTALPPVTIERLSAERGPDQTVQIFATLRNHTDQPRTAELVWTDDGSKQSLVVPANATASVVRSTGPAKSMGLRINSPSGPADLTRAFVACRESPNIRVALAGRNSPAIQRYVQADEGIELVTDQKDADVVIAVGDDGGDHGALILIDPPSKGPFSIVGELSDVPMDEVVVRGDSLILAGVDWGDVGVRRVNILRAGGMPLASFDSTPVLFADVSAGRGPGVQHDRVVIPFDISPANTNWALTPSFAVFMANAVRWVAYQPATGGRFDTHAPLELGARPPLDSTGGESVTGETFVRPGLYRDHDGNDVAVSLVGLRSGQPALSVAEQVDAIELCEPSYRDAGRELWPVAAVAGLACLLTGWLVAAKKD